MTLDSIEVIVSDPHAPLEFGIDESYVLNLKTGKIPPQLLQKTYFGVLRAMESFVQLVEQDDGYQNKHHLLQHAQLLQMPRFPLPGSYD